MRPSLLFLLIVFHPAWGQVAPSLFMPERITQSGNERDMAISPDGQTLYYSKQGFNRSFSVILTCHKTPRGWSKPAVAAFSGTFQDLEPAFSPDGRRLYFASNRPLVAGQPPADYNIWFVERDGNGWSAPLSAGSAVNTAADEFYPAVTRAGDLYFTASYSTGIGREDIYVCRWKDGAFAPATVLDSAINTKQWEFNAYVSPDESYILFTSFGRKDDAGGGDLYIAWRDQKSGRWQRAVNLRPINSAFLDYCPFVSADGKTLFFTSNRHGELLVHRYRDVQAATNSLLNGLDNIYVVDFAALMRQVQPSSE